MASQQKDETMREIMPPRVRSTLDFGQPEELQTLDDARRRWAVWGIFHPVAVWARMWQEFWK